MQIQIQIQMLDNDPSSILLKQRAKLDFLTFARILAELREGDAAEAEAAGDDEDETGGGAEISGALAGDYVNTNGQTV